MNKIFRKKLNKKGFTLIELIVVIAILGILAVIAIPRFTGMRENANESAVISNLRNIQNAAEMVAAEENVEIDDEAVTVDKITTALGSWPTGPSGVTYGFSGGVASATVPTGVPYPDDGVTSYSQLVSP